MTEDFISSLENDDIQSDELAQARNIVQGLAVRVTSDKKAAFAPDIIAALRFLKAEVRGEFEEACDVLKACGVSIQAIKQEVSKDKLRLVQAGEKLRHLACDFPQLRNLPELIRSIVVPSGYKISADDAGGYELILEKPGVIPGTTNYDLVAHCAPFVTGRTKDIESDSQGLRLSWSRGDKFEHLVVNRAQLSDSRSMISLSDVGYPVNSNNAKLQVDYFARAEAENLTNLPTVNTTSHLSWQGKKDKLNYFLVGRELIQGEGETINTDVDLNSLDWPDNSIIFRSSSPGADQTIAGFKRGGSFEAWKEAAEIASQFPRVIIGLYASFASIMLPIFDCPNFILDFCSRTSQGKTTTQRIAGSVWGDPDERKPGSVVLTWNQTKVSVERRLAILGSLPLFLDDTKKAADTREIPKIIYSQTGGQGRGRGSLQGIQTMLHWQNILISSGEQPITSFSNDGGVKMRVLEIEGAPFGEQNSQTARIVEALNFAICQNYGHAGPEFVQWLMQNRAFWPEWRAEYVRRVEGYTKAALSEKASRLAAYAAVIAQTATLVHTALDLPWQYSDPLSTLWDEISIDADDPLGCKKALRYLLEWCDSNSARFVGRELEPGKAPVNGWLGKWERGDDSPLAIYPKYVEDILSQQKFHPDSILKEWRERGWLDANGPNRFTKLTRIRVNENPIRLIVFTEKAMAEIRGE